ncbi:hypothetical protein [Nostoc sp. 2RC]|uniref:hypothetical protein n=1 Tax=Nostoc sp. 2RC TaxID=2485484 RepID=UPI001628A1ED|nr:hypothetical protein [Nostoc sp. 2RC]MBC1235741.1 hypothetical protein [Nostoc sp. 2RC]
MAKARRRLSDLVHEETQKARVTDLATSEVTNSENLPNTSAITDLQTSEATESVSLPEALGQVHTVEVTEQQTNKITDLQTSEATESVSLSEALGQVHTVEVTEQQTNKITDLQSNELPKYLKLERKEARLRQEQIDALTELTRKLNRMKRVKGGERLTDNTLIRVAVDLLLSKASELQGTTEEELRSSLGL